jgi:SH3-like domain-containing protein
MCRWFVRLPTLCLLLISSARGDQTFPYKAYVTSGEVYVRSGPGKNYYPTSKLKTGDQVEVYRHDPGGWFAIRPPSGSFTWVSARYLEKGKHGLAKVVGNEVAARVGSEFSDIRDVIQVRLHRGEVVEVLESKEFRSGPEAGTWYKVAPPSGEFRWVAGKFVDAEFPHDGVRQTTAENNPLIHPTATSRPETAASSAGPASPPGLTARRSAAALAEQTADPPLQASSIQDATAVPAAGSDYATRQFSPSQATRQISPEEFQAQLDQLDSELAVMLVEEPSVWKFDEMGLRARDLVNQAETAVERGRARQLVARIEQSEDVKLRYDTIHNLKTQTERENRQLAQTASARAASRPANSPEQGFDGTGRLARVVSAKFGTPQYALVDNQNNVICYVTPAPGVNMQYYIGRRVGITGERGYDTNARAQHLMAQHVTPLENGGTAVR